MFSAAKSMAGAMCIKVVGSSQKVCCPIHPAITSWNKTFIPLRAKSVAGLVGAPAAPSVVFVPSCAVLRRLAACAVLPLAPSCEMVRDGADGERSETTALYDRNVSFQPARNIPSLCWRLPPVPPAAGKQQASSSRQAAAGKQQQASSSRQAAAASSSSSSRSSSSSSRQAAGKQQASRQASSKQQRRQAAEASSRGKQQRQAAEASSRGKQQRQAAEASSSSSRSSKQQQQQAAGKQQQASSSKQAASKQQPAFAPLKEWTNISFKNQRDTQKWTFSRRTALKQWNRSITKSCDDAKLELFPGARPPDTTFRSWYDLTLALVTAKGPICLVDSDNRLEIIGAWWNRKVAADHIRFEISWVFNSSARCITLWAYLQFPGLKHTRNASARSSSSWHTAQLIFLKAMR